MLCVGRWMLRGNVNLRQGSAKSQIFEEKKTIITGSHKKNVFYQGFFQNPLFSNLNDTILIYMKTKDVEIKTALK